VRVNLQALVGKKIRRLRLECGFTIEELAFRAQLHPNYLGDIERGKRNPALANLKKIAEGLKKPLTELISDKSAESVVNPAREKPAGYFLPAQDKNILSLIKSLHRNSEKDREYVIRLAKSISVRLKNS